MWLLAKQLCNIIHDRRRKKIRPIFFSVEHVTESWCYLFRRAKHPCFSVFLHVLLCFRESTPETRRTARTYCTLFWVVLILDFLQPWRRGLRSSLWCSYHLYQNGSQAPCQNAHNVTTHFMSPLGEAALGTQQALYIKRVRVWTLRGSATDWCRTEGSHAHWCFTLAPSRLGATALRPQNRVPAAPKILILQRPQINAEKLLGPSKYVCFFITMSYCLDKIVIKQSFFLRS